MDRSNRLPTGQTSLDIIGYVLANQRLIKHLVRDDRIVPVVGKLPIHGRPFDPVDSVLRARYIPRRGIVFLNQPFGRAFSPSSASRRMGLFRPRRLN
jgi:hypothetical protein